VFVGVTLGVFVGVSVGVLVGVGLGLGIQSVVIDFAKIFPIESLTTNQYVSSLVAGTPKPIPHVSQQFGPQLVLAKACASELKYDVADW
jgi:hypothetical protein